MVSGGSSLIKSLLQLVVLQFFRIEFLLIELLSLLDVLSILHLLVQKLPFSLGSDLFLDVQFLLERLYELYKAVHVTGYLVRIVLILDPLSQICLG